MLVLSRRPNEFVVIVCPDGTRIQVMVVEVRGDKSRLGFNAPKDYAVHRSEVLAAIEAVNQVPQASA